MSLKEARVKLPIFPGGLDLILGRDLNVFVGENGTGKSAILDFLASVDTPEASNFEFCDTPETNLGSKLLKAVALDILQVASSGKQVFIATHSIFLLRELHILRARQFKHLDVRYFGLHFDGVGGTKVAQGASMDDIGSIAALDEDLQQSDRYLDLEMGVTESQV
jgi:predicted ATPase